MRNIFGFLTIREKLQTETVCKWWQGYVDSSLRSETRFHVGEIAGSNVSRSSFTSQVPFPPLGFDLICLTEFLCGFQRFVYIAVGFI